MFFLYIKRVGLTHEKTCAFLFWLNGKIISCDTFLIMLTKTTCINIIICKTSLSLLTPVTSVYWTTNQSKAKGEGFKVKDRSSCFGVKKGKEREITDSRGSTGNHGEWFQCPSTVEGRQKNYLKKNRCVQASALADVSFCISVVFLFNILHRLFLSSNVLKLACFWVPHTFDLHLEFGHLDAKEFLWTQMWTDQLVKCNTLLYCMSGATFSQELTRIRACSGVSTSPSLQTSWSFSSVTTPLITYDIKCYYYVS